MKLEDIKDISEEQVKNILIDIYNTAQKDADYYREKTIKSEHDDILSKVHQERVRRIEKKLNIARKTI